MRNNLLSKDIIFEGKLATWQDIIDVYNTDCNHGESRILHKLTDEHVIPGKIKKMKASLFNYFILAAFYSVTRISVDPKGISAYKLARG